jgi:N-acetylglucosaminyl-diphospho-decaprenol L-rhamnosyltransferase
MFDRDEGVSPGAQPRVAVVIVTYNSASVLRGCLDSLTDQGAHIASVVVADNASHDDSVAIAREATDLPIRTVQLDRNAGYAAAINAGIAAIQLDQVDAVFVANPDCRLRPGALRRLADTLREPGRGIAIPRVVNPGGSLQPSLRRTPTVGRAWAEAVLGGNLAGRLGTLGELVMDPREYERARPACWGTGAAMLLSTELIRDIGPWDESFFLYSEETEYALRARDRGHGTWYEPAAVVEHIGGESATNPALSALLVVNKVILFRRRNSRPASWAYFAAIVVNESIRALAGRRVSRAAADALLRSSRRGQIIRSLAEAAPAAPAAANDGSADGRRSGAGRAGREVVNGGNSS